MQLKRMFNAIQQKFARHLPPLLLRKLYTPGRLSGLLAVQAHSGRNTVNVNLSENASFDLCLEVCNESPFSVEIASADLIFWCCGTQLCSPLSLPGSLAPGEKHTIVVKETIAPQHASQIAANRGQHQFGVAVSLKCSCELHDFFKATGYLAGIRLCFTDSPRQNDAAVAPGPEGRTTGESYASA